MFRPRNIAGESAIYTYKAYGVMLPGHARKLMVAVLWSLLSGVPVWPQDGFLASSALQQTQTAPGASSSQSNTATAAPAAAAGGQNPCIQPATIFIAEEYTGPMKGLVRYFVRKPEIKTVHLQRGAKSSRICALNRSEKFHLFLKDTINPVTFIVSGFEAGLDQAQDNDPTFGQGAEGYGKRYGAALADQVSSDFFHTFAFPVIFRQDPRYYRLGYGSSGHRLKHAMRHVFVAHADGGGSMFNYSEWLGTIASQALSNTYHPGHDRSVASASGQIAINVAEDMGVDILREFWPEIVRKLRLPFRVEVQPPPK